MSSVLLSFVLLTSEPASSMSQSSSAMSHVLPKYERNFSPEIFGVYYEQLTKNSSEIPQSLQFVLSSSPSDPKEFRAVYQNMLTELRASLEQNPSSPKEKAFAFHILTGVNLTGAHRDYLQTLWSKNDEEIESTPSSDLLKEALHVLEQTPTLASYIKNHSSIRDLLGEGFLSSFLFDAKGVSYLHLTLPLIVNKELNSETVDPIFLGYLRHLKQTGQRHLFVNLRSRLDILEALANSDEFNEVLSVITLDKNSDFYWQENGFEELSDAGEFKKQYALQILDKNNDVFYFPESWFDEGWALTVQDIIDGVHEDYFESKLILDIQERQAFMELTLTKLIEAAKEMVNPNFVNLTCRFTNDRGPSQYTLDYVYTILKTKGNLTVEEKRNFLAYFYISPIVAHNRAPHDYRMNRLAKAIEILSEKHALVK